MQDDDGATPDTRLARQDSNSAATGREPSRPPVVLDADFDLNLLDGEQVLYEGHPLADRLRKTMMVGTAIVLAMTGFGLLLLPLAWFLTGVYIKKHRYWLTSSRVIVTTGIIGYRARSIPLERISDVAVSCSWLDKLMGIRSVMVRDMTGEAQSGAAMLAVPNASEVQQHILGQVHQVNRRKASPDNDRMLAAPYRKIEWDRSQNEILELLRRIENNTRET